MSRACLSDCEVDALLAPLGRYGVLILAISGGGDSTALLHLAAGWKHRAGGGPTLIAATVDHGLRAESASEAAAVAGWAASLGVTHRTLKWLGLKPTTGLQDAARQARYHLLGELAAQQSPCGKTTAIVTAHTSDDQAETLLMRLMRGSGVDGLAAIPGTGHVWTGRGADRVPIDVARPFIGVSRAVLAATLAARKIPFINDPSNHDHRFERVRVRAALANLTGLGLTHEALARTAQRMQRAQAALSQATDELWATAVRLRYGIAVEIDAARIEAAPDEIGLRVLRRAIGLMGGAARRAELSAVEDFYQRQFRGGHGPHGGTLGGTIVERRRGAASDSDFVSVYREPDRSGGLATLTVKPGECAIWDDRFELCVSSEFPNAVEAGPLGDDWTLLSHRHPRLASCGLAAGVIRGLPAWRLDGVVVAVPTLSIISMDQGDMEAAAELAGPLGQSNMDGATTGRRQLQATPLAELLAGGERDVHERLSVQENYQP